MGKTFALIIGQSNLTIHGLLESNIININYFGLNCFIKLRILQHEADKF